MFLRFWAEIRNGREVTTCQPQEEARKYDFLKKV